MDVARVASFGHHGRSHKFMQLFVIADSELQMLWLDRLLPAFCRSVASEFQDFTSQVFKN